MDIEVSVPRELLATSATRWKASRNVSAAIAVDLPKIQIFKQLK